MNFLAVTKFFQVSCHFSMIFFFFQNSMIFPGFPGDSSFFQVFSRSSCNPDILSIMRFYKNGNRLIAMDQM